MAKATAKKPAPKAKAKAKAKAKKPAPKPKAKAKAKAAPMGPGLRSIRSVIYTVGDLAVAKQFYAAALGKQPYFDQPFYVGFEIDGQELGLDPDTSVRQPGPGGAVAYWRVADITETWNTLTTSGAEPIEPPHSVGGGISVAVVADPFGNYVGLISTTE